MHQRAEAVVGEEFEQHGMRGLAVNDDHALEAGGQPKRGSTPASFVGAGRPQKFLNICLDQMKPNIPVKLLAPLI